MAPTLLIATAHAKSSNDEPIALRRYGVAPSVTVAFPFSVPRR